MMIDRQALRRAPRTPHAGAAAEAAAVLALEAFDAGAALVDLTHHRLAWCSPGFAARCPVAEDITVARLELQLPGLAQALARLAPLSSMRRAGGEDGSAGGVEPARESGREAAREAAREAGSEPEGEAGMAPCQRWPVGKDLVAEAALVRPGLAALRLRSAGQAASADRDEALRRHLEDRERLLFTSRSLAVGEMASTLAHELNQPIGTVANVLRGLRTRLERAGRAATDTSAAGEAGSGGSISELQGGVQLALEQALFAARIIARIREYTQSRTPRRERLDLGHAVQQAVGLLDWEIRRDGVELGFAQPAEPCFVEGDEVMLQQLFVNLLRNALEAMRDNPPDAHGRAERRLALALQPERAMAVLTVRDNGCGLPQDADDTLFVPFQSTKPNGMGIGLNICRSFVELHQGRLWFTRNDDAAAEGGQRGERGCTFHVSLPLSQGDAA
jgi:signal transduction histidine kinase